MRIVPFAKLNHQSVGYRILWGTRTPMLSATEIDTLAPHVPENLIWPSLAIRITQRGPSEFIAISAGRWPIKDEYGRFGISSLHGFIVRNDAAWNVGNLQILIERALSLMSHPVGEYQQLARLLQQLAVSSDRMLSDHVFSSLHPSEVSRIDQGIMEAARSAAKLVLRQLDAEERIIVHSPEPWGAQFTMCALIIAQQQSRRSESIASGILADYGGVWASTGAKAIPGFGFVDLSPLFRHVNLPANQQEVRSGEDRQRRRFDRLF
jgi:hypothetical protein